MHRNGGRFANPLHGSRLRTRTFVELPSGSYWYIGAGGALVAAAGAACAGRVAIGPASKFVAIGALVGVGTVVALTFLIVTSMGFEFQSKGPQAEVAGWSFAVAVPIGILAGGVGGWRAWIRRRNQDSKRASEAARSIGNVTFDP